VVPVDLYGQCADYDPIIETCENYGVPVIEDAAEALGATYQGAPAGSFGEMAIFSFNGNKIITTTGGGMVVARDAAAIARMRKWANQSREPAIEYLHAEVGYNYRLSNVLAGIGRGQLKVLDDRVAARRAVAARYAEALADVPGVRLQPEAAWGVHSRWLSVLELDPDVQTTEPAAIVRALEEDFIETRPVWRPMHTQPMFERAERVGGEVAERIYRRGLCLPSSSSLSEADQERVISALRRCLLVPTAAR
jgi:dTDP-4-amino-4,6-dideoxygalactose transaminase